MLLLQCVLNRLGVFGRVALTVASRTSFVYQPLLWGDRNQRAELPVVALDGVPCVCDDWQCV